MLKQVAKAAYQQLLGTEYSFSPRATGILKRLTATPGGEPLVLISQISRSGGTLLSQLLDNHPQVWMHPHELNTGHPEKWDWPSFPAGSSPVDVFSRISEPGFARMSKRGRYQKGSGEVLPIDFNFRLQANLFRALARHRQPTTDREWFDAYFQTFFAAWQDHRPPSAAKYIGAFGSNMAISAACMDGFRATYPDGKLVSIIREPVGWYKSVKRRSEGRRNRNRAYADGIRHYSGLDGAEDGYVKNCTAIERNRQTFGADFMLLDFDDLVHRRDETMRQLCAWLGIDYSATLLEPTFNGRPIAANTSFSSEEDRSRGLDEGELARVADGAMGRAYQRLRADA